jgi:integrase
MASIKLKHVDSYIDATGKRRHYFRKGRGRRVALPGSPGSPEFVAAWQAACDEAAVGPRKQRGAPGTFDRLVQDYFDSPNYLRMVSSTQRAYRLMIERFVRDDAIGHRRVDQMRREHVNHIVAKRSKTPGAANDVLKKLRVLLRFAMANGQIRFDPTIGIKGFAEGEIATWTEDEIEQFKQRWPAGTPERMAFALLLYTGQRRSDVVRMSWRDIDGNAIRVIQQKTGTKVKIPLHPQLRRLIDDWPKRHVVVLATAYGKPFSAAGFGNWMAAKIAEAGLPDHCVTHGLRKAAARRLAEAGCSAHQIMAITGHKSLAEAERYTRAADQERLAEQAIGSLPDEPRTKTP